MVSKSMSEKWSKLGWSRKISGIELLFVWLDCFCLLGGLFRAGLQLFLIFYRFSLNPSLHSLPKNMAPLKVEWTRLQLATVCVSRIAVLLLFLDKVIFLKISSLPHFIFLFRSTLSYRPCSWCSLWTLASYSRPAGRSTGFLTYLSAGLNLW